MNFLSCHMITVLLLLIKTVTQIEAKYLGCYNDNANGVRDLDEYKLLRQRDMTHERCRSLCRGFKYFGVQYGGDCFCGNSFGRYGRAHESECAMRCYGNPSQFCGDSGRNSVFITEIDHEYLGCYNDDANGVRDLGEYQLLRQRDMTHERCRSLCRGFKYFGVQYGGDCFCGDRVGRYGKAHESECAMECYGNPRQICGDSGKNSVYTISATPIGDGYMGCYIDGPFNLRDLNEKQVFHRDGMTHAFCRSFCCGYKYFGVQDGGYCFCGNKMGRYGKAPESECRTPCSGNPNQICGNARINSVYNIELDYGYMGCYQDDRFIRDLSGHRLTHVKYMTHEFCLSVCQAYTYFGVQNGTDCYCGNHFGRYGRTDDWLCKIPCAENPKQNCGGLVQNAVFKVRPDRRC